MVKKDYFPTQEVPSWVKDRVMNKIKAQPKRLRLLSMVRFKLLVPVTALLFMFVVWYIYIPHKWIWTLSQTSDTSILATNDALLQQKLTEAEAVLNDLSTYANQQADITI